MKAHEKDHEHHLSLATNKITELLKNENWIQVTFMVPEYNYKRRNDCEHVSEHFFTSGYKMHLAVCANGEDDGEGTYISVFLRILHGPHDDQLDWPLKGTFIIELLNQLEVKNHHRTTIDYPGDGEHCRPGGSGWGEPTFIEQSELNFNSSKNTQYLKDDKLNIRVTSNMPSSHKPWLDLHS